jgi:hypothetical protein
VRAGARRRYSTALKIVSATPRISPPLVLPKHLSITDLPGRAPGFRAASLAFGQ